MLASSSGCEVELQFHSELDSASRVTDALEFSLLGKYYRTAKQRGI